MKKICLISDTHGFHENFIVPECDILIHAGDFTNRGEIEGVLSFFEWLRKQPAKNIVFIAGNHDRSFDKKLMEHYSNPDYIKALNMELYYKVQGLIDSLPDHIHYIENESIEIEGFNIYGSPVTPAFGHNWGFNKQRGDSIMTEWGKIPKNTDILITHGPAYGILDYVDERYRRFPGEDLHTGCHDLLKTINQRLINLKLHVSGHIHDNYGIKLEKVSNTRHVLFCNAAVLDNKYNFLTKYVHTIYI